MILIAIILASASSLGAGLPLAPASTTNNHAIVVGGGPVGIAAALTLASNHNYNVTLLETAPESSDQRQYDPTKAFLYNVNSRGQALTRQFPDMHKKLVERSVPSGGFGTAIGGIIIVPADPNEEVPLPKQSSQASTESNDELDDTSDAFKSATSGEKAAGTVGYWVPRHTMVELMAECIEEHNSRPGVCKIDFQMGQECLDVIPTKKTGRNYVCVTTKNSKDGSIKLHQATLVVGADGMKSRVRQCLATAPTNRWDSYRGFKPEKFKLKQWTSPASHLRIKVLQLPPRFEIPNKPGLPPIKTEGRQIYALRSVNTGPRNYLSLGLLPNFDNDAIRATNIVTRPDHEVWNIKDGPTMQQYFQKAYPRLNFGKEGGMIDDEEWERFAKAEGTRFPFCQFSEGLSVYDGSGSCGVALVGDALHAFPPDIGQGVNAGLMDVVCLDRALQGRSSITGEAVSNNEPNLRANLERYQRDHAPETAALIRLSRFGAPYQYKQPHRADRLLLKLWTLNVAMRLLLNKLTFGLVQKPAILLAQDSDLNFRQVMRRADMTTAGLKATALACVGLYVKRRFGFGFLRTIFGA